MTPVEELDLARAMDFASGIGLTWQSLGEVTQRIWLDGMRAIRLGDEERGLRVVPVYPTDAMADGFFVGHEKAREWDELPVWEGDFGNFAYSWSMAIAASPFAPEEKG